MKMKRPAFPAPVTALLALALPLLASPPAPLHAVTDRPLKSLTSELKPAEPTTEVTFVVAGDNRPSGRGAPQPRVVGTIFDEISLLRPALVLWSGDTVYGYCDTRAELEAEYDVFAAAAKRGGVPLFNSPGNHEIHDGQTCNDAPAESLCGPPCSEEAFRARFGPTYGSIDYAGVHFISLDTSVPGHPDEVTPEQVEWLKQDLEKNKGARAIFVFCHTEFYSSPIIDPDEGTGHPAVKNRWELQDLFRRYPVKAVFAGHEHVYFREGPELHDGITYFVAGGAGAPVYAPPERGGFSHYIVVRLTQEQQVTYDVVEPGRLYVEPAAALAASKAPGEARFWIVNSNHIGRFTLAGIEVEVPAKLGACADLAVATELKRYNGQPRPVPIEILSCTPGKTSHKLRLRATDVPQGSSVPVVVRKKGGA
jgi:hypothetical protein